MDPELRQPAVRQKQAMKDEARFPIEVYLHGGLHPNGGKSTILNPSIFDF
jgi:hypothetical protein